MSYSKKIIKSSVTGKKNVHIGEHFSPTEEGYVKKTAHFKIEQCEREVEQLRIKEIQKVMNEVDEIRRKAYEEGKEQMREEIILEVQSDTELAMRRDWEEKFKKIEEMYDEAHRYLLKERRGIEAKKEQWIKDSEEEITDIIIESIKKAFVKEEVSLSNQQVKEIVRETAGQIGDKSKVVWIRVHPWVKKEIEDKEWSDRRIEWIADPTLKKMDVLIETQEEWIDSTMQNKIENLKRIIGEWVQNNDLLRDTQE